MNSIIIIIIIRGHTLARALEHDERTGSWSDTSFFKRERNILYAMWGWHIYKQIVLNVVPRIYLTRPVRTGTTSLLTLMCSESPYKLPRVQQNRRQSVCALAVLRAVWVALFLLFLICTTFPYFARHEYRVVLFFKFKHIPSKDNLPFSICLYFEG